MLEVLRQVGDVVHKALKYAVDLVEPGRPLLEICEKVESFIRANDMKPAFPVNIGINDVAAHYTAKRGDILVIPKSGVVKIDVGAHKDGYIVDAAVTKALGSLFGNLTKAARSALEAAINTARPGVRGWQIGGVIEATVKNYGFNPVYNLTGHKIERYVLHAGHVIPNYPDRSASQVLSPGDVYAVEPFVTNGGGYVIDGRDVTIYRLAKSRHKAMQHLIDLIKSETGPLPFSPRWFPQIGDDTIALALRGGVLYGYNVLLERGGGFIAQFEDTVYVSEDGVVPLARPLELA
ncbi:MAG: type II methionyl aminopeptidase [Pyrobaculum sp.]